MHVHILGICGTFMGGIAAIAKAAGHRVTGSDKNVYPPMSTQLEALGIELIPRLRCGATDAAPDVVVVGNVMTRGVPVIEALLESSIPYASGPNGWRAKCCATCTCSGSRARTARPRPRACWRGSSNTPVSRRDS